jgi:hypothetical protein
VIIACAAWRGGGDYGLVLAYARRRVVADLAQDVVADTFLAAWRNIDDLPPEPLHGCTELYAMLVSLPGVHFSHDAVDVAGRLGVGLYWVQGDQVVELIVNPRTYVSMGTMSIAIKGHPSIDALLAHPSAAAIMDSAAILDSGIVSGAGQVPGGR